MSATLINHHHPGHRGDPAANAAGSAMRTSAWRRRNTIAGAIGGPASARSSASSPPSRAGGGLDIGSIVGQVVGGGVGGAILTASWAPSRTGWRKADLRPCRRERRHGLHRTDRSPAEERVLAPVARIAARRLPPRAPAAAQAETPPGLALRAAILDASGPRSKPRSAPRSVRRQRDAGDRRMGLRDGRAPAPRRRGDRLRLYPLPVGVRRRRLRRQVTGFFRDTPSGWLVYSTIRRHRRDLGRLSAAIRRPTRSS